MDRRGAPQLDFGRGSDPDRLAEPTVVVSWPVRTVTEDGCRRPRPQAPPADRVRSSIPARAGALHSTPTSENGRAAATAAVTPPAIVPTRRLNKPGGRPLAKPAAGSISAAAPATAAPRRTARRVSPDGSLGRLTAPASAAIGERGDAHGDGASQRSRSSLRRRAARSGPGWRRRPGRASRISTSPVIASAIATSTSSMLRLIAAAGGRSDGAGGGAPRTRSVGRAAPRPCARRPASASTVASATASRARGERRRPQAGGHPGPDEAGPHDEHAHAAAGERVGQPLGERVEAGLGRAVDRVAGARALRRRAREDDQRASALPAQRAQRGEQQRRCAQEVDPHHPDRLGRSASRPACPPSTPTASTTTSKPPARSNARAIASSCSSSVVGVDQSHSASRSSAAAAAAMRSRSRPSRCARTGPSPGEPRARWRARSRTPRRSAERSWLAPAPSGARDRSATRRRDRSGRAPRAIPAAVDTSPAAPPVAAARPCSGTRGRRPAPRARRSGRAHGSRPGAARGRSSASVHPAIGKESGATARLAEVLEHREVAGNRGSPQLADHRLERRAPPRTEPPAGTARSQPGRTDAATRRARRAGTCARPIASTRPARAPEPCGNGGR